MRKKKNLLILLLFFIVIFISTLPLLFFYIKFKNFDISDNISDWSEFGTYVGGVNNTLISLISLLLLGYITYILNAKNNLLSKKREIYNEFTEIFPDIYRFSKTALRDISKLIEEFQKNPDLNSEQFNNMKNNFYQSFELFEKFHYYIITFEIRHSHLFNYDFKNEEYIKLTQSTIELHDFFNYALNLFENIKSDKPKTPKSTEEMFNHLTTFINKLRKEIK